MDELTKGFLTHWQKTHPGGTIKYFDASEPVHISQFNLIEEPTFPPKTLYKDFPLHENETKGTTTMPNERDEHFYGAASCLWDTLQSTVPQSVSDTLWEMDDRVDKRILQLIAQFAYDLVEHVLNNTPNYIQYEIEDIPDLTEWPKPPTTADSPTAE